MRIFVLAHPNSGTRAFYHACKGHITNYTVGHETNFPASGTYPDNHIEISCRLVFVLPSIRPMSDDGYVWLHRNRNDVIESWMKRSPTFFVEHLDHLIWNTPPASLRERCELRYDLIQLMIHHFVAGKVLGKSQFLSLDVEECGTFTHWSRLWHLGSLQGDFDASLATWGKWQEKARRLK